MPLTERARLSGWERKTVRMVQGCTRNRKHPQRSRERNHALSPAEYTEARGYVSADDLRVGFVAALMDVCKECSFLGSSFSTATVLRLGASK